MPSLLERLTSILKGLQYGVGNQWREIPRPELLTLRLARFIAWTLHRLPRALEQARAGYTPPPPRPRPDPQNPGPSRPRTPPKSDRARATQAFPMPRRESWLFGLVPVGHKIAGHGGQFIHLITTDPEIAPYLSSPPVHRLLRPLCRMIGQSHRLPPLPLRRRNPVGRTSEASSATAAPDSSAEPPMQPGAPSPPPPPAPKPPKLRRIPYHKLRLPLPRAV